MNRTSFIISVASLRMALCFVNVLTEEQKVVCQKFRFEMGKNVVNDHALDGHVIERYTVKTAAQCHMMCRDNCLCLSINYLSSLQENNCELNDAVKRKKPEALKFKSGAQYYDLVRMHSVEVRASVNFLIKKTKKTNKQTLRKGRRVKVKFEERNSLSTFRKLQVKMSP